MVENAEKWKQERQELAEENKMNEKNNQEKRELCNIAHTPGWRLRFVCPGGVSLI